MITWMKLKYRSKKRVGRYKGGHNDGARKRPPKGKHPSPIARRRVMHMDGKGRIRMVDA